MRGDSKHSWFKQAVKLGEEYKLDVHRAFLHPWPKIVWKQHTKLIIREHWMTHFKKLAAKKSTLVFMMMPSNTTLPHPLWTVCKGRPHMVQAATTRARMLTGRYATQSMRAVYSRGKESPNCQLCSHPVEDIQHIITSCPALSPYRDSRTNQLIELYKSADLPPPSSNAELCSAVLNGSGYTQDIRMSYIQLSSHTSSNANQICNLLCHNLNIQRDILYNSYL